MRTHSCSRAARAAVARIPVAGMALLLLTSACYQYRVAAPGPVSPGVTEPKGEVLWSFLWGFVVEAPVVDNCQGQGMAEVTAKTNLGFMLLTVVTVGIVSPMRVEWRCAPPTPPEGGIPPAGAGEGTIPGAPAPDTGRRTP